MPQKKSIKEQISELRALEYNYDSYGAGPPSPALIDMAEELLSSQFSSFIPAYMFSDSKDGSCLWLVFKIKNGREAHFVLSERDDSSDEKPFHYCSLYVVPTAKPAPCEIFSIESSDPNDVGDDNIITLEDVIERTMNFLSENYKQN